MTNQDINTILLFVVCAAAFFTALVAWVPDFARVISRALFVRAESLAAARESYRRTHLALMSDDENEPPTNE